MKLKLIRRLQNLIPRKQTATEEFKNLKSEELDILLPHETPSLPTPTHKPRGGFIRATKRPEYEPDAIREGGRVVRAMPRSLRKLKENQEKIKSLPGE
jgi:hypothetical protein